MGTNSDSRWIDYFVVVDDGPNRAAASQEEPL